MNRPMTALQLTALVGIMALAALLYGWNLSQEGYGNTYYAAAVRSMLENGHNFFFNAFDPAGFITIDKPPLGFWLQTVSALLFGYKGWALLLPQVIAALCSVLLLFKLVSRSYGTGAGLLSSLLLTLTPVAAAAARNNTIDSLLVLTLLLASWSVLVAAERGSGKHLLVAAFVTGLGFNIKMMEAFMVLPAMFIVYSLSRRISWRHKVVHFAGGVCILAITSFSWIVIVDSIPVDKRPFIGSTKHNSMLELALGHNAEERFTHVSGNGEEKGQIGVRGPLRIFQRNLGEQASWLLPIALIGAVRLLSGFRRGRNMTVRERETLFWLAWLVPSAVFFSIAGFFHLYYLIMLAPPIAALAGAGIMALWRDFSKYTRVWYVLPLAILITGAYQLYLLYGSAESWALFRTGIGAAVLVIPLLLFMLGLGVDYSRARHFITVAVVSVGLFAVFVLPLVWASTPLRYSNQPFFPYASPGLKTDSAAGIKVDPILTEYLLGHKKHASYLTATPNIQIASALIISTGQPVLATGGYSGNDPAISIGKLTQLAQAGDVQYFLLKDKGLSAHKRFDLLQSMEEQILGFVPESGSENKSTSTNAAVSQTEAGQTGSDAITQWIYAHCRQVPETEWNPLGIVIEDNQVLVYEYHTP